MIEGSSTEKDSALRVLRSAAPEVEALRREPLRAAEARGYLLRVANAVDRSLRRVLRDDESADLPVRLRALAPDEMRSDEVLTELRRTDRLPMPLAAAIHELFESRRRLERGGIPEEGDARRAVEVFDRLESEIAAFHRHLQSAAEAPDDMLAEVQPAPSRREKRRPPPSAAWLGGAAAIVILVFTAIWVISTRAAATDQMDEGIALFRSGAFAEAAHHFWRYAQDHPQDPTPHLYLARIHRRMERPELAADALREAQLLAPEDPAVHRELGFLLLDTGQPEVAVDRFRHALDLDAESSEAWIGLVRALRDAGRAGEVDGVLAQAPAEVRALLDRPAPPP